MYEMPQSKGIYKALVCTFYNMTLKQTSMKNIFNDFKKAKVYYLLVCVCLPMCFCVGPGTCIEIRGHTMWVPVIKLRSSGLAASAFSH